MLLYRIRIKHGINYIEIETNWVLINCEFIFCYLAKFNNRTRFDRIIGGMLFVG